MKITELPIATSVDREKTTILMNQGGAPSQMKIGDFSEQLNVDDARVLNDLAFYIDINQPSAKGASRVDVGGNEHMRQLWENSAYSILMDANGNYCELNRNDCRYTSEGEAIVDLTTNALLAKWANCDMMVVIPEYYGRIQEVNVGGQTILRPWFSLVPLPNGYIIPQQVVGKFKANMLNGKLRSTPNVVPTGGKTIYHFWEYAQTRSKNHGLVNLDFRNYLLFYMMAKYGYRDSQNCKTEDGTLVWGVGLDGSESTLKEGQTTKTEVQTPIRTGSTLSLGISDGNAPVLDLNGDTCHSVNVCGFENPWGQYWEIVGGLASVGTDVYSWRGNFIPSSAPTAETFANVECVKLTRTLDAVPSWSSNIITSQEGQGVYMIPNKKVSGINYGDGHWARAEAQLCFFGGNSNNGVNCGLAMEDLNNAWLNYYFDISTRLAYYGSIHKVSPTKLAELAV